MNKIDEAKHILQALMVPVRQQSALCCYTLLSLAKMKSESSWRSATNEWMRIHDIIEFTRDEYGKEYAENSRETFRKQAMHPFRTAAFIEDNNVATNSPGYRYRLTPEMLELLQSYTSDDWETKRSAFLGKHQTLVAKYASQKVMKKLPVVIDNQLHLLSTGKHNQLQVAIVLEFAPRFAPHSEVLYLGDTTKKYLIKKNTFSLNLDLKSVSMTRCLMSFYILEKKIGFIL